MNNQYHEFLKYISYCAKNKIYFNEEQYYNLMTHFIQLA